MMVDGQPAAATATIENVSAEGDAAPGSAPSPRRSSRAASAKKEEKTKETEAVPTAAEAEEETKDGEKGEDAEVEAVGDWILEVNGKDTAISGFAPLLPKSREAPIRLKLARLVTLEEASLEAEEKAIAKLAEATDAPELPEGATSSATEARRRLFASAVSAATKAGLDKEAIKVVQVKLARLPPPPPKPEVTYRDPFELPPMPAPGT
ncbi:hypothetical protein Ctob_014499 [Chrysochromulina tobinii]|uniref:Uncharacterized protein n=1 Tax=Chrysochromulina tobinii TaxID=1460289 RepID=A0A0M0JW81_9EUKA|nr:hypothetical protein Ctob_014499 [Chrysochromulina tobinii]|eukprot:KOO30916.1 hypothetical protein Ctob_014499 [Chrysochromulina sp. CCMP291]